MLFSLAQSSYLRFFIGVVFLSLAGCVTQLAPPYDKNITDTLNSASTETMTLLASASQGLDKNTFSSREEKYNSLIGKLDALALSAGARPIPKNNVALTKLLESRSIQILTVEDSISPSAHAIEKVSETLTVMRDTDKEQGINPFLSKIFKNQISIYFDQAITYENFLQR